VWDSQFCAYLPSRGRLTPLFGDEQIRQWCTRSELCFALFALFALFASFASNSGAFGFLGIIGEPAGSREGREVREEREELQKKNYEWISAGSWRRAEPKRCGCCSSRTFAAFAASA
jgi:hypothetical protein